MASIVPSAPYVPRPIDWETLRQRLEKGELHLLGRSEEVLRLYRTFSADILKEYTSMGDYVCHTVFGYPLEIDPSTSKKHAIIPEPKGSRLAFRPNDFPYYFEEGIEHHVLWSESDILNDEVVKQQILLHRPDHECLFFINPLMLQSIKSVAHAHILSRRKKS